MTEKDQLAAEKDCIVAELASAKEERDDYAKELYDVRSRLEHVERQADTEREQLQATITRLESEVKSGVISNCIQHTCM